MKFTLALLTAIVAPLLAGAVSVTPERRFRSLNPHNVELSDPLAITPSVDSLSNAERLRRGLNPKTPRVPHTPTRAAARRAAASPVSRSGYFKVIRTDDDSHKGFVRKDFNVFGEFGITDKIEEALPVGFSVSDDGKPFDISEHNQDQDQSRVYPFIGLTNGFASTSEDFGEKSANYAYLTGVPTGQIASSDSSTNPNSFSTATGIPRSSQSKIWNLDADSKLFSGDWINSDNTEFTVQWVYYGPDDVFIATGSYQEFVDDFGSEGVYPVKLVFVEAEN